MFYNMATISKELWFDGFVVEEYRNIVTSCYAESGIVCLVT